MRNTLGLVLGLLLASGHANAEGNCPEGYYPYNATGVQVACAPIPGYGGSGEPADPGPSWQTRWGAIATADGAFGTSNDMTSKRRAERQAVADCKKKGGNRCKVKIAFYNQCAALAWGETAGMTFRSPEIADAEQSALKQCSAQSKDCKIYYSGCSYPKQVR
jgi:Domain of unknown function (DUF4189)